MKDISPTGVSVIVCCYNSAGRLSKTLDALARQQCDHLLTWELIIVDNASTDETAATAIKLWKATNAAIQIKVVTELMPGLGHARKKGVLEAKYSCLVFCDDDNWLEPNYIQGIFDMLNTDDNLAACGGMGIPVFETEEPSWFYEYAEAFAIGSQDVYTENGRLISLYGAGMGVKKHVIESLYRSGFEPLFAGRTSNKLSSSEDTEITGIFVLMGYKLGYSDELKFYHFLPKNRLTTEYLRNLFIAFGTDGPVRNLYYSYISTRYFHQFIKSWLFHLALGVFRLIKYSITPPKRFGRRIYFNWSIAYIRQLLRIRSNYENINKKIAAFQHRGDAGSQFKIKHTEALFLAGDKSRP